MEEWKKGSYYFPELLEKETEVGILGRVSGAISGLEKKVWKNLGIRNGFEILDLGCGPGFICEHLAHCYPNAKILGVDISDELLAIAEHRKKELGLSNLNFKQGDVYDLPLKGRNFDFIYSRFVFQHLKCPIEALRKASSFLNPDGKLCVVEIDDRRSELHPRPKSFEKYNQMAAQGQTDAGGDRHIGGKLGSYFHEAGLVNIKEQIFNMKSHDIGIKNFLDVTMLIKLPCVSSSCREEAECYLEDIYSIVNDQNAWGEIDIFVISGERA